MRSQSPRPGRQPRPHPVRLLLALAMVGATLSALAGGADAAENNNAGTPAPLFLAPEGEGIEGAYIITLDTTMPAAEAAQQSDSLEAAATRDGGQVTQRYRNAVIGFAADLDPAAVERLRAVPSVASMRHTKLLCTGLKPDDALRNLFCRQVGSSDWFRSCAND